MDTNILVRCESPAQKKEVREWFQKQKIVLRMYGLDQDMTRPLVGWITGQYFGDWWEGGSPGHEHLKGRPDHAISYQEFKNKK